MHTITQRLETIQEHMVQACQRAGRSPHEVQLMAVSKRQSSSAVSEAIEAGQLLFGENRVQEAKEKQPTVSMPAGVQPQWHMIGPLQKNKIKYIGELFHMVQTVDTLTLAQAIGARMQAEQRQMPILLQVNVGGEAQKNGMTAEALEEQVRHIAQIPGVRIQGLMTVPPYLEDPQQVRPYFRALYTLANHVQQMRLPGVAMETLSMGMSHDFHVAIEEGATMVRVGSALFGERRVA
ncbi:alanine racemase domain protein [Magnetococcus marinus MC-1]|uniref:Pyridoxal phosphate homeostasis protein n=1 Tax=Magnetococcus marinus (strain ATCC BAA-1437 / JCM 17883 / MC-1) TaxID=156889 RepID=A0LDU9_MAGMM|nr:YggS family pyridoxal phosphate-dependent enzyme [Magnetococcus marinus]ABK46142.1 alanine racemase domain protein [Magnetococcus marinus MC-1]